MEKVMDKERVEVDVLALGKELEKMKGDVLAKGIRLLHGNELDDKKVSTAEEIKEGTRAAKEEIKAAVERFRQQLESEGLKPKEVTARLDAALEHCQHPVFPVGFPPYHALDGVLDYLFHKVTEDDEDAREDEEPDIPEASKTKRFTIDHFDTVEQYDRLSDALQGMRAKLHAIIFMSESGANYDDIRTLAIETTEDHTAIVRVHREAGILEAEGKEETESIEGSPEAPTEDRPEIDRGELTQGLIQLDNLQLELDAIKKPDSKTKILRDRLFKVVECLESAGLFALRLDYENKEGGAEHGE